MKKLLLAGSAVLAFAHAAPALADETFMLDTYSSASTGYAGPVYTSKPLSPGAYYLVTIQGTFSKWTVASWQNPGGCGTPESAPMFPSTLSNTSGPVGVDPEVLFAASAGSSACRRAVPQHQSSLQIDTGNGLGYVTPEGGPYSTPKPDHAYTYVLQGSGTHGAFGFAFADQPTNDNYGSLQISVHRAAKEDCKSGGWRQFGSFKNQGNCVSYMTTNGRSAPNASADAGNDE